MRPASQRRILAVHRCMQQYTSSYVTLQLLLRVSTCLQSEATSNCTSALNDLDERLYSVMRHNEQHLALDGSVLLSHHLSDLPGVEST